MDRRIALLILALLLAAGTFFLAQQWLHGQLAAHNATAVGNQKPAVRVLVAKTDLPAGTILSVDSLRWQLWAPAEDVAAYLAEGRSRPEDFVGWVVRARVAAGEPLIPGEIIKPGDRGFMAAVLSPGMRGLTINVSPSSGVAGFLAPGDHVDMLLSLTQESRQPNQVSHKLVKTFIPDLRIVGVDQILSDLKAPGSAPAHLITLEVTPKQAELISVAGAVGGLSLTLRSVGQTPDEMAEVGKTPDQTHTWDVEVTQLSGKGGGLAKFGGLADAGSQPHLLVVRGDSVTDMVITPHAPGARAQ